MHAESVRKRDAADAAHLHHVLVPVQRRLQECARTAAITPAGVCSVLEQQLHGALKSGQTDIQGKRKTKPHAPNQYNVTIRTETELPSWLHFHGFLCRIRYTRQCSLARIEIQISARSANNYFLPTDFWQEILPKQINPNKTHVTIFRQQNTRDNKTHDNNNNNETHVTIFRQPVRKILTHHTTTSLAQHDIFISNPNNTIQQHH